MGIGAGWKNEWHSRRSGSPVRLSICPLPAATAQNLWCHRCKGFGGCSHESSCPWGSTHCVIIATREWGGLATPFCCVGRSGSGGAEWDRGAQQVRSRVGAHTSASLGAGKAILVVHMPDVPGGDPQHSSRWTKEFMELSLRQ
jgi:hypothetical protein